MMKIVAINGSPKGKVSNTNVMVTAFLQGAQTAGAETVNVYLAEKEIQHCKGCFSFWINNPGQCIIKDDMAEIMSLGESADVLVLATPLYVDNISGILKTFMDRSIVKLDPHFKKDPKGECRHLKATKRQSPRLVMMANCGFPERSHFQVVSHWIKRAAINMHTEVIGEIYATQGGLLTAQIQELQPIISNYLHLLEKTGAEVVTTLRISEETDKLLERNFIPDEIYIQQANHHFDTVLKNGNRQLNRHIYQ